MAAFPKYARYKDSGVEWLGEIPSHWQVSRLKHSIKSATNGIWGSDVDDDENDGIVCIRVADFNRKNLRVSLEKLTRRKVSNSEFQSRKLSPGDLLLEKSGGGDNQLVGQVVLFEHDISAVCSNFLARLRVLDNFDSSFLNYVHASLYALRINYKHIKQTTGIQNIDGNSYLSELFAHPDLEEQQRIVEFLDRTTADIDHAISQKQRLIQLLQEQKAILINQAVTKGLNPNAPMRDSGVDAIGDIPEHWEICRAKYLFKEVDERSKTGEEELLSVSHLTGVTPRSEKNVYMFMAEDYSGSKLCRKDDLVINIMWAWMGALGVSEQTGIVSPSYGVFRQIKPRTFNSWYLEHLLRSIEYVAQYNRISTGLHSSRLRLYSHMFLSMEILFPSRKEQDQIEAITTERTGEIDTAINATDREVKAIEELRSILISQAVTGKIKV